MTLVLLFSAFMGWCGTPWRWWFWWWRRRKKPPPPPPPDWFHEYEFSDPMPGIVIITGIAGGIGAGLLMNNAVADNIVAVGLAAFAGGRIIGGFLGGAIGR